MEIKQLRTLSQFIDWIIKTNWQELFSREEYMNYYDCQALLMIKRYNDFFKQLLKKEQFVNEIDKPENYELWKEGMVLTSDLDSTIWYGKCEEYAKAEKKVIFEGEKTIHHSNCIEYKHTENVSIFHYPEDEKDWDILIFGVGYLNEIETLHDLAEATNGELKLKNVEL
jgi:hypothetical protein